jgi:hypothetical protein
MMEIASRDQQIAFLRQQFDLLEREVGVNFNSPLFQERLADPSLEETIQCASPGARATLVFLLEPQDAD